MAILPSIALHHFFFNFTDASLTTRIKESETLSKGFNWESIESAATITFNDRFIHFKQGHLRPFLPKPKIVSIVRIKMIIAELNMTTLIMLKI